LSTDKQLLVVKKVVVYSKWRPIIISLFFSQKISQSNFRADVRCDE